MTLTDVLVEPLSNGHIGTSHFVLYRKCILIIVLGPQCVSFIERFFSIVSFIQSVHYQRFHCIIVYCVSAGARGYSSGGGGCSVWKSGGE